MCVCVLKCKVYKLVLLALCLDACGALAREFVHLGCGGLQDLLVALGLVLAALGKLLGVLLLPLAVVPLNVIAWFCL